MANKKDISKSMESYIDDRLLDYQDTKIKQRVFEYIKEIVKVSRANFFRSCGYKKDCSCNESGVYTRYHVRKYLVKMYLDGKEFIKKAVVIHDDEQNQEKNEEYEYAFDRKAEKDKLEIEKLKVINEDRRFSLERKKGNYIAKSDVMREISGRLLLVFNGTTQFYQSKIGYIIEMCGGDQAKASVLLAYLIDEFNQSMSQAAQGDMLVLIEEDD